MTIYGRSTSPHRKGTMKPTITLTLPSTTGAFRGSYKTKGAMSARPIPTPEDAASKVEDAMMFLQQLRQRDQGSQHDINNVLDLLGDLSVRLMTESSAVRDTWMHDA